MRLFLPELLHLRLHDAARHLVIQAEKEGKEFDEKAFGEELSKFEHKWTESHTKHPVKPQDVKTENR